MSCWPANATGAFVLALLIFDMVQKDWTNLPNHALFGVILVGVLFALCKFLGSGVAGAVLLIPAIVFIIFFAGILFTGESLRRSGCCVSCSGDSVEPPPVPKSSDICYDNQLKAIPL